MRLVDLPAMTALFFGYVQSSFTARAVDFVGFIVGWDFQFQTAQAGQEDKLVDPSHDVTDLAHLGFEAFFLFGFFAGLADRDFFFGKSGHGYDRFCMRHGAIRIRVVFKRDPVGQIAQDSYSFGNGRVGAGQVGKLLLAFFLEGIGRYTLGP